MANVKKAVGLVLDGETEKLRRIIGSSFGDVLTGSAGADALYGLAGDDQLNAGGGNDFLDGGQGADQMTGGAGNDIYVVDDSGDRVFESFGEGLDTVLVGFRAGQATTSFTLGANIEDAVATGFTSQLTGNSAANNLRVDANSEVAVFLSGLDGDDTLTLGKKGGGADGGNGNDVLIGALGNDQFSGGAGDDRMHAYGGNDALRGGAGRDFLDGGDGNDELYGDDGNDRLRGGAGNDVLFGGRGADSFIIDTFGAVATVRDFKNADGDKLDLRTLVQTGGADPIAAGYVRLVEIGGPGATSVAVQIDGNGGGDNFTTVAIMKDQTIAQLGNDFFLYL